jgi:cellulose synthase/poly-beta-1,6-N-acetylglucosamine synthase-like glycosyltransferase
LASIDFINTYRAGGKKKSHSRSEAEIVDLVSVNRSFIYEDFAILIPIFGDIKYLKNVDFLKKYGSQVVLCTTTKESDEFNAKINEIAKMHGFRIFRSQVPLSSISAKPNPWKLFRLILKKRENTSLKKESVRDEIIKESSSSIKESYCIFLDADTVAKNNLNELVSVFRYNNYDIASVRVLASKENTLAEKLQAIEYRLAMDARRIYPWLTSGACMIAKTDVMASIMSHHSLFFSGGDIEIGKLAKMLGYRVGHIPFVVFTDVPETFKAWFKQRMVWCGGSFRHSIINCTAYIWRHPFYFLYFTIIVFAATPLRWYELIKNLGILPLVYIIYLILILTLHRKHIKWYYLLFPLYALVQVMFIVPLGVYAYLKMAKRGGNIGIIRLRGFEKNRPKNYPTFIEQLNHEIDSKSIVQVAGSK